jgi:hypothetical protein
MRPEARQKLDAGFQRRAAQRREQLAVNWQHAVQVGRWLGLGEPLGIYHTEITPGLGARRVLLLLTPVVAFVLAVVLLAVWAPDVATPLLGVAPCLAGACVLAAFVITRRLRFTRWLYGYADGLAEVDPDGQPRPLRWDEVTDVVDEWSSAGSESQSSWSYEGFRLTAADGRTVSITAKYENALDPYAPIGGIIAALPRLRSIADLINEQVVAPVAARQAEAVRGGAVLVRGDVRVTRDGISGPKDAAATPWAAIERVELRPGRVKVRPIGGKARKYDNYRDGSGYAVLCRVLRALGVDAAYEAGG